MSTFVFLHDGIMKSLALTLTVVRYLLGTIRYNNKNLCVSLMEKDVHVLISNFVVTLYCPTRNIITCKTFSSWLLNMKWKVFMT